MKKIIKFSSYILISLFFIQCSDDESNSIGNQIQTVSDIDGNIYNTIVIGNQTWMVENLKTTTYSDGTPITEYTFEEFGNDWNMDNQTVPLFQWADTSDLSNAIEEDLPFDYYGTLYNEAAIKSGKLAPTGWKIPSEQDFIELKNYVSANGFMNNEDTALKSISGWSDFFGNGTDDFGFNTLPNGYCTNLGSAAGAGAICNLASSTTNNFDQTRKVLSINKDTMDFFGNSILLGSGIRCLKN
ncbi:hypothetical protein ES692_01730 [Psychroserpens burtonensis]|uniref:Fibrobacter succinogenes major paralogous domain-containing protein n=1 Tax=Psychroserpens burtonensis TaxID=49278 RepID=A0A5C7BFN3_9FLAO|nr:fibrobacter succinogenes major paralogous domain-containing protein [Psychroserpens burtonensis]TXE20005.1 hypothetical protein ES692_01730 [Psychroserpens burtonensis]